VVRSGSNYNACSFIDKTRRVDGFTSAPDVFLYIQGAYKVIKSIIVFAAALSLSACGGFTHKAEIEKFPESGVIFSSPSVKTSLIQDPQRLKKICMGRGADAVFEESESGDLSISMISVGNSEGDKIGEQDQAGEQEMTGRTPAVLMARELFYRACELTINEQLKEKDALELFYAVLKVVKDGWIQEGKNTSIKIGENESVVDTTNNNLQSSGVTLPADSTGDKSTSSSQTTEKTENKVKCTDPNTGNTVLIDQGSDTYKQMKAEGTCP